jgi:chromosome segregation ATPase
MRNQRVGQATFIPLDTIQVKPANDKFRTFAKGVRLAVDNVEHEPAIERAIHHACGSALICDSMDTTSQGVSVTRKDKRSKVSNLTFTIETSSIDPLLY